MLEQRIQQQFFEGADLQYQSAEPLSRQIAGAAQALLTTITAGGKVLICGAGMGAVIARHCSSLLLGRFERDRPPLAAMALRADEALPRQVLALAHPGDALLVIDGQGGEHLLAAAQAARQRDASVVVLAPAVNGHWAESLSETDVLVAIAHERPSRVAEMQMLVVHCLCDALDMQLLGEQDT